MKINTYIITILFFICSSYVKSQEMLGIINSNYSGINSTLVNPASMLNSKLFFDFNIGTADVFFQNNYTFLSKNDYKFSRLFKKNPEYPKHQPDNEINYYNLNNTDSKNAYLNIRAIGPSAMFILNNHAIGFHTSFRTIVQAKNIPYNISSHAYNGLDYDPLQNIDFNNNNYKINELSFTEIGFSYAYSFYNKRKDYFSAGITIKRLYAYSGTYLNIDNSTYKVSNDTTLAMNNISGEIGFAAPLDYDENEFINNSPYINDVRGKGWSFDIGITYQKKIHEISNRHYKNLCQKKYQEYKYRIGISLLDIGKVNFDKNAQKHYFDNVSHTINNVNKENFTNFNNMIKDFSYRFYNDSTQLLVAEKFSIALPSAISLQFDYRYKKHLYINSSFFYSLKVNKEGQIERPGLISITPRYEKYNFEVNIPFSLYEFKQPRIGLAVRFYDVTIGTDKLGGFFNFSDFYGLDLYCSVKISLSKGRCFKLRRWSPCQNYEY